MRKILFLFSLAIVMASCEKGKVLKGEYLEYDGAAVLQADTIVYGVVMNDKALELNKRIKEFQKQPTDMVPVEVRAKITPKPKGEEGWDFRIDIQEILKVSEPFPSQTDTIKLESN